MFGLHAGTPPAAVRRAWRDEVVWVGPPTRPSPPLAGAPLPLILAPDGCVYRQRMTEALDRAGRPWRIAYTSRSLDGIKAGVLAGLGVTAMARSSVPDGLATLPASAGLPRLAGITLALHHDPGQASEAVQRLAEFMAADLSRAFRSAA